MENKTSKSSKWKIVLIAIAVVVCLAGIGSCVSDENEGGGATQKEQQPAKTEAKEESASLSKEAKQAGKDIKRVVAPPGIGYLEMKKGGVTKGYLKAMVEYMVKEKPEGFDSVVIRYKGKKEGCRIDSYGNVETGLKLNARVDINDPDHRPYFINGPGGKTSKSGLMLYDEKTDSLEEF